MASHGTSKDATGGSGSQLSVSSGPTASDMLRVVRNILTLLKSSPERSILYAHCADALALTDYEQSKGMLAEFRKAIGRGMQAGAESGVMLAALKRSFMWSARHNFDDYMLACEWNREPKAKFWAPRRKVLEGKHGIASKIQAFIDDPSALYLGFSLPPGCGKTTLIKFLLSYICGRWPQSANMYVSYSDGMVKLVLDSEKAIQTDNSEYCHQEIFPENGLPDISTEFRVLSYRRKGDFPTIGFISIGGSVTGRTRANKFLITDDLVRDKEMARSPERLARLFDDYSATLTTRMIGDNVKQIQLGTIWSVHDPISRMKSEHEGDPRYQFIAIPVWDEHENSNFEFEHPDRYTSEKIRIIKESLDPADFSCLYLQRGVEKEGLAFPDDSLLYYNGVLPGGEPDNVCFFIDTAWGGGDSLSMPIAYVFGDDVYIHDVVFDRGDKSITQPRVVGKVLHHKARIGRIEANNGGDSYCDDINRMLRDRSYSMNLGHKKAPSNVSKLSRIEQHAPTIRRFHFRDTTCRDDEYRRFMDELTGFSFTAKNLHDDAPDSLAGLCEVLYRGVARVEVMKRLF